MHRATWSRSAKRTSRQTGRPRPFPLAIVVILAWMLSGPLPHSSDTRQLDKFCEQYENLVLQSGRAIENGSVDIGTPETKDI